MMIIVLMIGVLLTLHGAVPQALV